MKFKIGRASNLHKRPCERAYSEIESDVIVWYIDIETLSDLVKFIDEVGRCVIETYPEHAEIFDKPNVPEILIYDSWIE